MALAKWYKIDFHTHTPASNCFRKKSITADEWLKAAKDSGLNAVVITDHNSLGFIENIEYVKERYEQDGIFRVFYGIELCVSAEFTHILVIFDNKMSTTQIIDAVIKKLELDRENWGNTEINVTEDKLKELCVAYQGQIFVIPAHFNSNKGLAKANINAIKKYKDFIKFPAIEVRNQSDIEEYNNKLTNKAIESCALITGSDNPGDGNIDCPYHGINGFGKYYTWVKMSQLSFEGLNQVFLDPEFRCINYIDAQKCGENFNPNNLTYNYIAGLVLKDFKHVDNFNIRFSPHLNCIIGGRGTGKSTIVQAIKASLSDANLENNQLIQKTMKSSGSIQAYYNFGDETKFLIKVTRASKNELSKKYTSEKDEIDREVKDPPTFPVDIYGQKEIFALIEQDDNTDTSLESPLVKMIDEEITHKIYDIKDNIHSKIDELLNLSQSLLSVRLKEKQLATVKSEITTIEAALKKFKDSNIEEKRNEYDVLNIIYLQSHQAIEDGTAALADCIKDLRSKRQNLSELIQFPENLEERYPVISSVVKSIDETYEQIAFVINSKIQYLNEISTTLKSSNLYLDFNASKDEYEKAIENLKGTGYENIKDLHDKLADLKQRESQLLQLKHEEEQYIQKIESSIDSLISLRISLSEERNRVVQQTELTNLAISIIPLAHKKRWKMNVQKEFGKENVFDSYFDLLSDYVFSIDNYQNLKTFLRFILTTTDGDVSAFYEQPISESRFLKLWTDKFNKGTLNSLVNLLPEDMVEIKIVEDGQDININEGSPGQKCAAILSFILSNGNKPLIIDQPEDDLDNSLIYNLIVTSIRTMKKNRQIIIVTHNPNIPVLGDAEGIIMIERDNNGKVCLKDGKKAGCLEEPIIRDGICEIMEGGKDAFIKREEKYQYKIK